MFILSKANIRLIFTLFCSQLLDLLTVDSFSIQSQCFMKLQLFYLQKGKFPSVKPVIFTSKADLSTKWRDRECVILISLSLGYPRVSSWKDCENSMSYLILKKSVNTFSPRRFSLRNSALLTRTCMEQMSALCIDSNYGHWFYSTTIWGFTDISTDDFCFQFV